MELEIHLEPKDGGHWTAKIKSLPGAIACGATIREARCKVEALALRLLAARIEIERSVVEEIRFVVALDLTQQQEPV